MQDDEETRRSEAHNDAELRLARLGTVLETFQLRGLEGDEIHRRLTALEDHAGKAERRLTKLEAHLNLIRQRYNSGDTP